METIQTTSALLNPANPADAQILAEILPQTNAERNDRETRKHLHLMRKRLGMHDSLYTLVAENPTYDDDPGFYNQDFTNFDTLYPGDAVSRLRHDSTRKYELFLEGRAMGKDYADSLAYAHSEGEAIKTKNRGKK